MIASGVIRKVMSVMLCVTAMIMCKIKQPRNMYVVMIL